MVVKKIIGKLYLLPLVTILIAVAYSGYVVFTTNIIYEMKHYLGLSFLLINIIIYVINKEWGIYFTGLLLLIGTFHLITFTATTVFDAYTFEINDYVLSFNIQLFSFYVLLLYMIINGRFLLNKLRKK